MVTRSQGRGLSRLVVTAYGYGVVSNIDYAVAHRHAVAAVDVDAVIGPARAVALYGDAADENVLAAVEEQMPVGAVEYADIAYMYASALADEII